MIHILELEIRGLNVGQQLRAARGGVIPLVMMSKRKVALVSF